MLNSASPRLSTPCCRVALAHSSFCFRIDLYGRWSGRCPSQGRREIACCQPFHLCLNAKQGQPDRTGRGRPIPQHPAPDDALRIVATDHYRSRNHLVTIILQPSSTGKPAWRVATITTSRPLRFDNVVCQTESNDMVGPFNARDVQCLIVRPRRRSSVQRTEVQQRL